MQALAKLVAEIDVLQSFAHVSEAHHFSKARVEQQRSQRSIKEGRHPVVERVTAAQICAQQHRSGKSTYMRQVALIVILADTGCFVPAEKAHLPIFDQIFTRIGAAG